MALSFGTSGIRGLELELTDELCAGFGRAFLRHFADQGKGGGSGFRQCILAGDLRRSTPRIMAALSAGIRAERFEVLDAGIIPTPALAFECMKRGLPGIMVTGSHIPADRNGIKFYFPWGEILKADEAPILAHEKTIQGEAAVSSVAGSIGEKISVLPEFTARYVDFFGREALKGAKIVFYEHSSAAREVFPAILEGMGAEVVRFGRSSEFIPVDTEAVESLRSLGKEVTSRGAAALLSTDGDGDRPLVIDERGQMIRGDQLGIISARELSADSVSTPLSSSTALELSGWFSEIRRCKIGSPFVVAEMDAAIAAGRKRVVGFEANGGFLVATDCALPGGKTLGKLPTRDCVIPALLPLVAAHRRRVGLSKVIGELPPRFVVSDLIREFPVERSRAVLARLREGGMKFLSEAWGAQLGPCQAINDLDGVRATFEGSGAGGAIVHLRPSGNAPEFRIYVEAETETLAAELATKVRVWVLTLA